MVARQWLCGDEMICYEFPYPPSVNSYWRNVTIKGKGRVLISERGRDYRADVCQQIGKGVTALNYRLAVRIDAWMPDNRRRDIDNLAKVALDTLTHAGVWTDDELIDDLRIVRRGVEKPGRIVVTIENFEKR